MNNMKYMWILPLLATMSLWASAEQESALKQEIQSVKESVLELNQSLYALEQDLLNPAATRAAFYLSLSRGEFFDPMAIEITSKDMEPIQHIYTERQVKTLRLGAVHPISQVNIGPGEHDLRIVIRGMNHLGQNRELVLKERINKTAQPLLMEIVIRDQVERKAAIAQVNYW